MQYRARKGNPAYPRLHNGWNIRYGYSTDGYYRKVYILLLHPVDDSCISFQSQYRTQILLGSGVAEGAAAYVSRHRLCSVAVHPQKYWRYRL